MGFVVKINNVKELIKNKDIQKQFLKYLLIGGSTAVFELLIYTFLRRVILLELSLSNIIAVVIATVINFIINKGWAFKSVSNLPRSVMLYLILFLLNTFFSTNAIILMVKFGIFDVIAKLVTMCCITMWNFILYRKVVFK